jgi:hypothetical protein
LWDFVPPSITFLPGAIPFHFKAACGLLFYYYIPIFTRGKFMQFHFADIVTAANLFVLLGIYRKMSIVVYQHKLMWTDFADRKHISPNGKHVTSL